MKNPVIERDLVGVLRLRKTLAMQIGSAVLLSGLVLLKWPTDARADLSGLHAQDVFRVFGYGLGLTMLLLVPAFPATSIVREKQGGTLALLLNSPLSPSAIYFGKLVGVLGVAFLPLLMSIPAACACYVMGGLSVSDLLYLYGVLMMLTVQLTAISLWISSVSESADGALRTTYGVVFLLTIVTLGPYQFVHGQPWPTIVHASLWLRSASFLPAIMEILGHADIGLQGLVGTKGAPQRFTTIAAVTAAVFSILTILRLNPRIFDRSRSQGVITDDRSQSQRWLRRFLFLIDPQRRSGEIGSYTNPVLIKEFRTRRFGRSHWTLRIVAGCAIISLGLTYLSSSGSLDWGVETVGGLMVILQVGLIILMTPGLSAGLLSAERESGGLALLQVTPLSPMRILIGKLMSAVLTTLTILLATLPGYLVMIYIKGSLRQQVLYVLVCLLLLATFTVVISALVGSYSRRTAAATATSYAVVSVFCAGPMFFWLGSASLGHHTVESALLISPMAAALSVMEVKGFETYNLVPATWSIIISITVILLAILTWRTQQLLRPK